MPIWSEILTEIQNTAKSNQPPNYDRIRRKYLSKLSTHTGRDTILYASAWLQKEDLAPTSRVSISDGDIQGFMEVCHGLKTRNLDLILHSPGGSATTAEAVVEYLRSRFDSIRVIVPQQAMSAATMIACAADEIIMGQHSFLGPTDPQLELATPLGYRLVPTQEIVDQFEHAVDQCKDPQNLNAWLPILGQYGPDIIAKCSELSTLSKLLVEKWLRSYMFKNDLCGNAMAGDIARWLASHTEFKSHARHLSRNLLKSKLLNITDLEADPILQDLVLSVYHATTHTLSGTFTAKIIENQIGKAFVTLHQPPQQN